MRTKYYYTKTSGLHIFKNGNDIPQYMKNLVFNSEQEAYAQFLRKKNDELQEKIEKAEYHIRQYKKQMQDNEDTFGYTKEMFPEVFI